MSVRSPVKIVKITKEEETILSSYTNKNRPQFGSFEETFKPKKQSTKSRDGGSPLKYLGHNDENSTELLTRNQIMTKLEMKIQEDEKEIDLNETSITGANVSLAKSKKDLSRSLIANLDNEVDNLKLKRSVVMAERDKNRKEQIKQALEDDSEDIEIKMASPTGLRETGKSFKVTAPVHKKAYEHVHELLSDHMERMGQIEKEYLQKAEELVSGVSYKVEIRLEGEDKTSYVSQDNKGKENLKLYSKMDPPPLLNSYMINPFLMRKKKETPQEERQAKLKTLKKKRDDLKSYKEKFLEYLEDKKVKVERGKDEPSPPPRKDGKMEFRLKYSVVKNQSLSPKKITREESPKKFKVVEATSVTPPHREVSPSSHSVKKLPSRRTSERKMRRTDTHQFVSEQELRELSLVFAAMKKGEKPTAYKEDIWNYMLRNKHQFEGFNVDFMNLKTDLDDFPSEFRASMSFEEFIAFLNNPRPENNQIVLDVIKEIERLGGSEEVFRTTYESKKRKDFSRSLADVKIIHEVNRLHNKFENPCLLSEDKLDLLKQVFYKTTYSYDDNKQVNRLDFIKKLREDENVHEILREPAVNISEYNETISVEKVLRDIENEYRRASGKQKKAKENITLSQFVKYFTNYVLDRENAFDYEDELDQQIEELNIDDGDVSDIQPERLQFFKDVFNSLPKDRDGSVDTETLMHFIYETEYYQAVCTELARERATYYDTPKETIEQTLRRIEEVAGPKIKWDDFSQYFTRRGVPMKDIISVERSRQSSRVFDLSAREAREETYKMQLYRTYMEADEDESEDDIEPMIAVKSKYMRYNREDKDVALNKKAFKAALQAAELEDEEAILRKKAEEEERLRMEELKKKVYGSKFGALYKESADFNITEPAPFSFYSRDKNRQKTIRERKLEEMLLEKEQSELEVLNVQFRANEVPAHVRMQLYDKIMNAQEERRMRVKMESVAITKAMENPFSFYERDMEKFRTEIEPPMNPEFDFKFKAKPLPKNVRVRDLWSQMQARQEEERKQRIAYLAEINANQASLPPRMAHSEARRQEKQETVKTSYKSPTKTFKANPVPDFEKLQAEFQDLLDKKRKSKKPTEARGFNFHETRKGVVRDYLNKENQVKKAAKDPFKRDPLEAVKRLKAIKPKIQPATTKKTLAMMDKLKADREEVEMRKVMMKMEEENRVAKYRKLKPRVQCCKAIVDMAKQKDEQDRRIKDDIRRAMFENQRRYEEELQAIHERVEARPLLVEQEGEKNMRLTRERAIREMIALGEQDPRVAEALQHMSEEERQFYEQHAAYMGAGGEYDEVAEEEEGEEEDDQEHGHEHVHRHRHEHGHGHGHGHGQAQLHDHGHGHGHQYQEEDEYQEGHDEIQEEEYEEGGEDEEGEELEEGEEMEGQEYEDDSHDGHH